MVYAKFAGNKSMTNLPLMTEKDLDGYLSALNKRRIHYRAEQIVRPSEYNKQMLTNLDQMAVEAMARYHGQSEGTI